MVRMGRTVRSVCDFNLIFRGESPNLDQFHFKLKFGGTSWSDIKSEYTKWKGCLFRIKSLYLLCHFELFKRLKFEDHSNSSKGPIQETNFFTWKIHFLTWTTVYFTLKMCLHLKRKKIIFIRSRSKLYFKTVHRNLNTYEGC